MKMISPLSLPGTFLVLLLFLLSFPTPGSFQAEYLAHDCNDATLYTPNSTFASNLNSLLSSLSSNSTLGIRFYNSTSGRNTNTVYGSYLCRGDVTTYVCQSCVPDAAKEILNRCPNNQKAIIWYLQCMLRYSNRRFFSTVEAAPQVPLVNDNIVSEPDRFTQLVRDAMDRIITRAASGNTYVPMFAIAEVNFDSKRSQKLYALVQCTPDLSLRDCDKCLRGGISPILDCCNTSVGAGFLRSSCFGRFELYPLYHITAPPPRPSTNRTNSIVTPPIPPPLPDPVITPGGNGSKSKIVIIVTVSTLVAIVLLGSSIYGLQRRITWQKRKKDNSQEVQLYEFGTGNNTELPHGNFGEPRESQDFPSVPLNILRLATENFSNENKLGEGGFGLVYKGVLPDGKELAVKRLSRSSAQGMDEFKNEIILIAKLQHKNLVRLLGCCLEGNEMMLVYEYMPNASLDVFLFEDQVQREQLDWKRRLSIIGGIARGLLYLHEDSRLRIIHRDLKPSNVLLDNEMNPKISDFGMARIFAEKQNQANTKRVVGTYGYMAPEYAMEGLFSVKLDVFSFGVILLEIISGRKNSGFHLSEHGRSLLFHAWSLWCEGEGLELMDPLLEKSCETSEVLKCIQIGLLCVQEDAEDRPTMSTVVVMLATDTITLAQPTRPAFSIGRVGAQMKLSLKSPMNCSINEVTLSNVEPR